MKVRLENGPWYDVKSVEVQVQPFEDNPDAFLEFTFADCFTVDLVEDGEAVESNTDLFEDIVGEFVERWEK